MKRLALALLLIPSLCLAAPSGKLLVVTRKAMTGAIPATEGASTRRFERNLRAALARFGVVSRWINYPTMKTEWGKTGTVAWSGWNTTSVGTEHFDAVLWITPQQGGPVESGVVARPDSLLNAGRVYAGSGSGLAVPNLFLYNDALLADLGFTGRASCCSTGVANALDTDLWIYGLMHPPGSVMGWFTMGSFTRDLIKETAGSGGYSPMLLANQPSMYMNSGSGALDCFDCDSIPYASGTHGADSVIIWKIPFSNIAGSKPIICAYADGNGDSPGDSVANNSDQGGGGTDAEQDESIIVMALAALDSSAGHALFDPLKLPVRMGLTIDAEYCFGTNRAGPGLCPQDTSVRNATIDSLAWLNTQPGVKVKAVVGLNADSLLGTGAYNLSTINRWRSIGTVRFSPQVWNGVVGSGAQVSASLPQDVFGFNRSRTFVGDGAGMGSASNKDTSVTRQLMWAKLLLNAAGIRNEEMSRTVLPPLDDWAPQNKTGGMDRDSALFAIRSAGFTTVRSNSNFPQSDIRSTNGLSMSSATYAGVSAGLMGYTSTEGVYPDVNGVGVKVLAHNGQSIAGGTGISVVDDSSNVVYSHNMILNLLFRTMNGFMRTSTRYNTDYFSSGDDFANYYTTFKDQLFPHTFLNGMRYGDPRYFPTPGSILKLNIADLSGKASGNDRGGPARTGWWLIKSYKNWMDAVNSVNGKTVVEWAYPEDIAP